MQEGLGGVRALICKFGSNGPVDIRIVSPNLTFFHFAREKIRKTVMPYWS